METLDLKRDLKWLYAPPTKKFTDVDVPDMGFLLVDGVGEPYNQSFEQAIEALYSVAYTARFALKKAGIVEYPVMPLEGLWWADDMRAFAEGSRDDWRWTLMIMTPDAVTQEHIADAIDAASRKKELPALERLRFERFAEGPSAQIMYVGPYADEAPTIAAMHEYIAASGRELRGKHHEIYLGDPRRSAPEKLRTILRQPYA